MFGMEKNWPDPQLLRYHSDETQQDVRLSHQARNSQAAQVNIRV